MSKFPDDVKYTSTHEWVRVEGDLARVGISDFAQHELGDVVFVELPDVARKVTQGEAVAVVESVKAASDVFAPITGEVVETNNDIVGQPALVNEDAEGKAWFFKLKVANAAELDALMDRAAYEAFVKESS